MKIEKLSIGSNKIYLVIGFILAILLIIIINIFLTRSKYRVTESIQIVSGDIYYAKFDYKIMKVYLQNKDKTNYVDNGTEIPSSGYKLRPIGNGENDSYCTINNIRAEDVTITYNNGQLTVNSKRKGAKCYLYFDIQETLADKLKEKVNTVSDGCPAYAETPSITTIGEKSLLCKGIDDFGDTYYYRGAVTNNWVKIGNFYWRIIRINGNGSIRLIYSGKGSPATSGDATQIGTSAFHGPDGDQEKYVIYSNSTIKNELNSWYSTNLWSTYRNIMDETVGFCNDADYGTYSSFNHTQKFKPRDRVFSGDTQTPTFKCGTPKTNLYTTINGTQGNQKLSLPIGLITVDEINFAGGHSRLQNLSYYLYTGLQYWTMSPGMYSSYYNYVEAFHMENDGKYNDNYYVNEILGVRPVINLKADTEFKEGGNGTSSNPYEVII